LDDAKAGDAVDDFVVDADADLAREIVDERRGGLLGAVFSEDAGPDFGEFAGGDAGADGASHGA
jgi:hypothetical protein